MGRTEDVAIRRAGNRGYRRGGDAGVEFVGGDTVSEEMRPCPFCGMNPVMLHDVDISNSWQIKCRDRECPVKGVSTTWFPTREEAVAAWNTRPVEDALRAKAEQYQARVGESSRRLIAADNAIDSLRQPVLEARIAELTAENERLRDALEWYADGLSWYHEEPAAWKDYGERARAALGVEGE